MTAARILIVEDEAIVAIDIQKILHTLGYDVPAIAFSGEEALRKVEEIQPDVIIMDIVIKGEMDGIEAAHQIHERFGIPSIFMTGYSEELLERLTSAQRTGQCFSCIKPFDKGELSSTINRVLEGRE